MSLTDEDRRMLDIKRRTPFHLQRGHRSHVFVTNGKAVTPATSEEIAELNAWEDRRERRSETQQIIYALERQVAALDAQANKLAADHDYSAEFPAEDAERLREAIEIVRFCGVSRSTE